MPDKPEDRAQEVKEQRDRSRDWMENCFYNEWEQVYKSYKCERDVEPDPNGHNLGLYDAYNRPYRSTDKTSKTSIGMPDTWAMVRRLVARTTAQIPNLKMRGKDPDRADRVSRKIMLDWDKGGVQRLQKKHVTQSGLFGWSVRAWYWDPGIEYTRRKRIDPNDPANRGTLWQNYGQQLKQFEMQGIDPFGPEAMAILVAQNGRGQYLSVDQSYKGYIGPRAEFLLAADCFPEPEFQSIQSSGWFIVERRRDKYWLSDVAKAYEKELGPGIAKLLKDYPNGTQDNDRDHKNLRLRMIEAIGRVSEPASKKPTETSAPQWKIIERHTPGRESKVAYVTEDGGWLGEIQYPYDLEGRIAFTETVLIDDLLSGIGDSNARVLRGLNLLHDRQVNIRTDLAYNILRPLVGTTNRQFVEEPELLKRHNGMRVVYMPQRDSLWVVGEQAAMAAVVTGLQDESAILRQLQMGSGETNMSQGANIDPQQARTATGSRIMAYNTDTLARDVIDMFTETCIKPDVEMMFLLNRSEMPESQEFDAAPYYRSYGSEGTAPKQDMISVSPLDFQEDFEIEPEVGSTLADDDESKVQKAISMNQVFAGRQNVNQDKLRDFTLITMGEGGHIEEWVPKQVPVQAPPPAPPEPPRTNISVTAKFIELPLEAQAVVIQAILSGQSQVQIAPPGPSGPPPPGGPGPGGPPPPPAAPVPEPPPEGASSLMAATGGIPVGGQR